MEFITSGDRIATENFSIGKIYTVTFTNGNYFINTCVGIGPDFVMFQQEAPKMLFCLDMESAETVSSIDQSGGGAGTMNYNELDNKPSINGVPLIGNKTAADLSILPVPIVGENDNNKILTASYSGGVGSYSWQPAPSSGTTDYTQLTNKPQINSVELNGNKSLEDLGIASAEALAGKQDVISDLNTIRSGAAAGATAVQPATLAGYQPLIDSSHKLDPALVATDTNNRFATDAQLNQIETNKTNISMLAFNGGGYNYAKIGDNSYSNYGLTLTVSNGAVTLSGTATGSFSLYLSGKITDDLIADNKLTSQLPTQIAFKGAPDTDTKNRIIFGLYNDTTWVYSGSTNDLYHDLTGKTYDNWLIYIPIVSGVAYSGTWRPMILSKDIYDSGFTDYQPYAMSNAELTAAIQAIQAQLANT